MELVQNDKTKMYMTSVYDSKVKQYMSVMTSRTAEEAIRSFGAAATQEGHDFKKFSGDFTLWLLGYYYPDTGKIESVDRVQIASASDLPN